MRYQRLLFLPLGAVLALFSQERAGQLEQLRQGFRNPSADARIMMRWWWFGSAVNRDEIEREMQTMEDGGIGGFEIQPVYPLVLEDPPAGIHNIPYLSDEYLDVLRFTSQKAKELGMRMDITLGSGWPFGGPHTDVTKAAGALRVDRVEIPAGASDIAMPHIGEGEKFLAAWVAKGSRRQFDATTLQRINRIERGRIRVPAGLNGYVAMFFISGRSGMQVKRQPSMLKGSC